MADLSPADIDVAQLYDAFTITPLLALEDLGSAERGESGAFAADGQLTLGGALPCNTDGGGLSSNHPGKRGIFALIEGARQLRGQGPVCRCPMPGGPWSTAWAALLRRGHCHSYRVRTPCST